MCVAAHHPFGLPTTELLQRVEWRAALASMTWPPAQPIRSQQVRSGPGGNRSTIARRSVRSAARLMGRSSMTDSIGQLVPAITTEFRVRSSRNKARDGAGRTAGLGRSIGPHPARSSLSCLPVHFHRADRWPGGRPTQSSGATRSLATRSSGMPPPSSEPSTHRLRWLAIR